MGTPRYFATAALLAATIMACDRSPTGPSIPGGLPGQTPVRVVRVEITGPSSIAPGEETQFNAIAHRSDASTEDATQQSVWQVSRTDMLSVTAGRVTAKALGEGVLQAIFQGFRATRELIVVPPGTFRVAGQITEGDSPQTPVSGVRVEAIGQPAAPPVSTGFDGRFRLYGVSGPAQIRAEKAGYQPVTQATVVNDHSTVNLVLPLAAPRLHVSGGYVLTIAAAAECQQQLPEETRTRRYAATAHQQGPLLRVNLSGATFVLSGQTGNSFGGRVEPSRVVFSLSTLFTYYFYYGYYGDVVEEIDASTYLAIGGTATLSGTSDLLEGPLNGTFATFDKDPRRFPKATSECRSQQHRFRLSR